MCMIRDERLEAIVVKEYTNGASRVKGVYETCDDAYVLVNSNVFERLLNNASVSNELSFDEIMEKYGKQVYEAYSAKMQAKETEELLRKKRAAGRKSASIRHDKAFFRNLKIIRAICEESTMEDITKEFGVSEGTVYGILRNLTEHRLFTWYSNNPDYFDGMTKEPLQELIDADFKLSRLEEIRHAKRIQRQREHGESVMHMREIERKYEELMGVPLVKPVEKKVDKPEFATFESVLELLGVSDAAEAEALSKQDVIAPIIKREPAQTDVVPPFMKIIEREREVAIKQAEHDEMMRAERRASASVKMPRPRKEFI